MVGMVGEMRSPTAQDAVAAVENALHVRAVNAQRFLTGLCHFVYEVTLERGGSVVVRLAGKDTAPLLAGGVYWHAQLMPLGLPLACSTAHQSGGSAAAHDLGAAPR